PHHLPSTDPSTHMMTETTLTEHISARSTSLNHFYAQLPWLYENKQLYKTLLLLSISTLYTDRHILLPGNSLQKPYIEGFLRPDAPSPFQSME
ncbi:hypothetical protein A0J61_09496, partial [Choanephora cucurbitarum]